MNSIKDDLDNYCRAMISGNVDWCIAIEKKYDLFGYPPEMVTNELANMIEDESN